MTTPSSVAAPRRLHLVLAFLSLYLFWGSTYLAMRWAIETLPPFLMASARHLTAGLLLFGWATQRRGARPTARQWLPAAIVGGLLLTGGNGLVVWSEQRVPSGVAALLVATVPLWIVGLEALRPGGARPGRGVVLGVALGLAGIGLLVGPSALAGKAVDPIGALALVGATLSWASGSLYSRHAALPRDPLLATSMQMLCGGALLAMVGGVAGEGAHLALSTVSTRSALSLVYLVIFGSLVGFTAYVWLLRVAPTAQVATYAYVNPVVAVFLGWLLAGEPLGARTLVAAAVILGAVGLISRSRSAPVSRADEPAAAAPAAAPGSLLAAAQPPEIAAESLAAVDDERR